VIRLRPAALVFAVLSLMYAVGLAGHLWSVTRPLMFGLTPWFLVISGLGLVTVAGGDRRSLAQWLVPTFAVTFALEALGVATGAVFGPYHYTTVLGPLVLGVPPVIGWNWVLVVLGAHATVRLFWAKGPRILQAAVVGLLCVCFDLVLEPAAISLGYWVWHQGSVPLQNYLAWGMIAATAGWWAGRFPKLTSDSVWSAYAALQAAFFVALSLGGVRG